MKTQAQSENISPQEQNPEVWATFWDQDLITEGDYWSTNRAITEYTPATTVQSFPTQIGSAALEPIVRF